MQRYIIFERKKFPENIKMLKYYHKRDGTTYVRRKVAGRTGRTGRTRSGKKEQKKKKVDDTKRNSKRVMVNVAKWGAAACQLGNISSHMITEVKQC